jgi:hypothetical protein
MACIGRILDQTARTISHDLKNCRVSGQDLASGQTDEAPVDLNFEVIMLRGR